MMHAGDLWTSVGKWAALRGFSRMAIRAHLLLDGVPIGRIIERYPRENIQIREIKGCRVLVKRVNDENWLYLPADLAAGAIRGERQNGTA